MLKYCGKVVYNFIFITYPRILAFLSILGYYRHMSFTYNPNKRKRATTHGFLVRNKTAGGKKILTARRQKGRTKLAV
jgi:large subunit ribosomal protein L34